MKFEITFTDTAEGRKLAHLYGIPIETKLYFNRLVTLDENDIFELLGAESDEKAERLEVFKDLASENNWLEEGLSFSIVETEDSHDDAIYERIKDTSLTWDEAVKICEFLSSAEDEKEIMPAFLFAADSYPSVYDAMDAALRRNYRSDLGLFKVIASDEEEAFAQYAEQHFTNCYEIPEFLENYIDWKKAGADMRHDCNIIDFDGSYWIARNC